MTGGGKPAHRAETNVWHTETQVLLSDQNTLVFIGCTISAYMHNIILSYPVYYIGSLLFPVPFRHFTPQIQLKINYDN